MKKVIITSALLLLLGLAANAQDEHSMHQGMNHSSQEMEQMHNQMHGQSSQVDAHFLDRFSKHHQDAIEMAKLAQTKAQSPAIKQMAQKMAKEQSKEVEQMKKWRSRDFASVEVAQDMPPKMNMSRLEQAKGAEFDVAFAEMMSKHHQDGLKMINNVQSQLQNKQVKEFAEQSKKNQSQQIKQLAQIRSSINETVSGTTTGQ